MGCAHSPDSVCLRVALPSPKQMLPFPQAISMSIPGMEARCLLFLLVLACLTSPSRRRPTPQPVTCSCSKGSADRGMAASMLTCSSLRTCPRGSPCAQSAHGSHSVPKRR